jgi:hypothetical protein
MAAFVLHSRTMTQKQRHTIAALAIANIVIVLALSVLVAPSTGERGYCTPTPGRGNRAPTQQMCQWKATQLLAQAGLGGKLTLAPDGPLEFEITTDMTGRMPRMGTSDGEPVRSVDEAAPSTIIEGSEAAQSVWTAFDVALALLEQEKECATFGRVEVRILVHGNTTTTQISALVNAADLSSFSTGELSEDEFIKRVEYTSSVISECGLFQSGGLFQSE